jgi:hypothetical protein
MKSMTVWLASAVALMCITGVQAADKDKANVIRDYTDTVAPADQQAYEAGVKSYSQCLGQHGFKYAWTAWVHETGDTYTYSYTSDPAAWASFDAMHAAGKACDQAFRANANPHLKSETSLFLVQMPELSHMAKAMGTPALIEVTYFTLKPGREMSEAFTDAVKKITAAAEKSHWSFEYITAKVRGGDKGAPDFVLVVPSRSWADFGKEASPPLWTMVESAYGKAGATALRKSLNDTIRDVSSHVDSYSADLSYVPSSK